MRRRAVSRRIGAPYVTHAAPDVKQNLGAGNDIPGTRLIVGPSMAEAPRPGEAGGYLED